MELSFKNNFNNSETAYCRTYVKTYVNNKFTTSQPHKKKKNSQLILKKLQCRYTHINGNPPPIKRFGKRGGDSSRK